MLLCVGAFCGYWWFYKLAPSRRTLDPEWFASHSQLEYWREVQKSIRRGMWLHDDGFAVGLYGDKPWAEWIMGQIEPGMSMGCLGRAPCHSASSMRHITNQDVGDGADAWLAWWEENKSRPQEEWIADGFRQHGVEVDVPSTPEHTHALLAVLGSSETNEADAVPSHLMYNAFRCLRDSGFEPVTFALSNRAMSAEIERGLLEYEKRRNRWPSASGVGILPFGKKDADWEGMALPAMLEPGFQVVAYVLVFGSTFLGTALLICSFRRSQARPGMTQAKREQ
jgi:hypothetical protein